MNIERLFKAMDDFICPVCGEMLISLFDRNDTLECLGCDFTVSEQIIKEKKVLEMIK